MQVLIIDDHPIVLAGCRLLVGAASDIELRGAFTAETAFAMFVDQRPDVVVLDLHLPGTSATALLRRLLDHDPKARVAIFSTNDDPLLAAQLIEAGAKGFVSKAEDPIYIVTAMREVAAGNFYMSPGLAQKVATLRLASSSTCFAENHAARARHPQHACRRQEHDRDREHGEPFVQDDFGDVQSSPRPLRRAHHHRARAHCRAARRLLSPTGRKANGHSSGSVSLKRRANFLARRDMGCGFTGRQWHPTVSHRRRAHSGTQW